MADDLGLEKNAVLERYYRDRIAWLLEPDAIPPRLTPYHEPMEAPPSAPPAPNVPGTNKMTIEQVR